MDAQSGRFLGGVAGLVRSMQDGRYLLLRRSENKSFAPGAWECVTGRVQQGEGFEQALHREIREEIGVDVTIEAIVGTTHFYRGPETAEYELLGVVYLCTLSEVEAVQIGPEHSTFAWVTAADARKMLREDHPSEAWLLRVLDRAEVLRSWLPEELLRVARFSGFELG